MALSSEFLAVLACPECKGNLRLMAASRQDPEGFLLCDSERRKYRIQNDIPVLLVEESVLLNHG